MDIGRSEKKDFNQNISFGRTEEIVGTLLNRTVRTGFKSHCVVTVEIMNFIIKTLLEHRKTHFKNSLFISKTVIKFP
jgi:hypothetical protein